MAYTPATSNTVVSGFTEQWRSIYDLEFEPQVYPQWFQKYNKGFGIKDFLYIAGQTFNVKSNSITAFEDGALVRPIRIDSNGISTQTSAGDAISFYVHDDEYDSNGDCYLRAGDTIIVPSKYLSGQDTPAEFLITTASAVNVAWAASPLDSAAQITTKVPANAYLQVGATRYARGTGQPKARSYGAYSRTFYTGISKETLEIEGGQIMQASYRSKVKGGGDGLWNRNQLLAEFSLDNQMNTALIISDYNSNSVTQSAHSGNSNSVRSTTGLWNHLDDYAQKLPWAVAISINDMYTAKELLRGQGVVDTEVLLGMGTKLSRGFETMGLEFLKEYSSSNLMSGLESIGIRPKAFTVGNVTFVAKEFAGLSNPQTFGVDADYWDNAGFMIPMSQVTVKTSDILIAGVEGGKVVIPNLALGYVNNNGENRTRILQYVYGVNGVGGTATHEYDDFAGYMLTEYMLVAMGCNQFIRLLKEGTY